MATRYFTLKPQPATLWATSDELNATRVEASVAVARGVDFRRVPVLSEADAAKFVFHQGLTAESVR